MAASDPSRCTPDALWIASNDARRPAPAAHACAGCPVRRQALFGVFDEAMLARLPAHISEQTIEPGQALYRAHEPAAAAWTIREGLIRLERSSERGGRRVLRLAGPGDLVGLEALLGQTHAADAIACTPLQVCRLPRALIDELGATEPALLRDLMKRWQAALDEAEEWLTELSTGDARWRMLRLLLKLSEYGEPDGRIWLPARGDIGAMLDVTVETASRLVAALKREGVMQFADLRHARLDMPRLLAALREAVDPG